MSKFSLSVYLNAYSDAFPSNQPGQNNFRWNRDLNSILVNNPTQIAAQVAPGSTLSLFNGMRTLAQDSTTQYSIALAPNQTSIYALTAIGGTLPNFRTPRTTGADATTLVNAVVNGPVVTFSSFAGVVATETAQLAGMSSPVTITAFTPGVAGNSVILAGGGAYAVFSGTVPGLSTSVTITANNLGPVGNSAGFNSDGVSTINQLIAAWNAANPSNEITLTSGDGTQIPQLNYVIALSGGQFYTVNTLISNWNTANPSNLISLISGDGTQTPSLSAPVAASYTGTPMGATTPITITANIDGTAGNVDLIGDGISTIAVLISAFNSANPSNELSLTSGDGTQIPNPGIQMQLAGGVDPNQFQLAGGVNGGTPFNLTGGGVIVGDQVTIGSNFNPLNQGTFTIIGLTATSFTVVIQTGTNEGPIALGSGFATQIQICSAAGVQIGDTIVISGGFSPATQGSYEITAVNAESVQFSSTSLLPAEGPITTEAITIYSNAKTLVYIESDSTINVIFNGLDIGQIEPFMISNAALPSLPLTAIPGVFMLKSIVYSLAVTNNGINPANITFLAVE